MVGIDVIDLGDPLLKRRDRNAMRYILAPNDGIPIAKEVFWHLWTAKEAIFKAKRDLITFDPKIISIEFDVPGHFTSEGFEGQIIEKDQMILAVVAKDLKKVTFGFTTLSLDEERNESPAVRKALVNNLHSSWNIADTITEDGDGLPVLTQLKLPVSLSHHARYIGYVYPNPQI